MTNRHHRRGGGRTTPRGPRPAGRSHRARPAGPPFLADAREVLADHSPLGLMSLASSLVQAMTPQAVDRFPGYATDRPDATAVFLSFTDPDWPPLNALALAASVLTADDVLSRRLRLLVDPAGVEGAPPWLADMDRITVTGVWLQTHVLGDGDNILLGWSWPGGQAASAVVYIDHNAGSLVKDAFVVDVRLDDLLLSYRELAAGQGMSWAPLDPAEARARIMEGVARADMTIPPFESDTWPLSRPLVLWAVGHLPEGGAVPEREEWSEAARAGLINHFLETPYGEVEGLVADQVRGIADNLVWFACDYGPGDPMRWSLVSVEIVLDDWYARKIFGLTDAEMRRMPDVLAAFVRFSHHNTDIGEEWTEETLAAVERGRPGYLRAIARPGRSPRSNAARLARLAAGLDPDALEAFADLDDDELDAFDHAFGADLDDYYDDLDIDDPDIGDLDDPDMIDAMERALVAVAGGPEALAALDDEPLPARPFAWSAVPAGLEEATQAVLDLLEPWALELFDPEVMTIARAVLAGTVAADPALLTRSARADLLAAAVLWIVVAPLVERMRVAGQPLPDGWRASTQKAVAEHAGVKAGSLNARTASLRVKVGDADIHWPSLLHSMERRHILAARRAIAEIRASIHGAGGEPGPPS